MAFHTSSILTSLCLNLTYIQYILSTYYLSYLLSPAIAAKKQKNQWELQRFTEILDY